MSKRIQLWLYASLCLSAALVIFFLRVKAMFALLLIYAILFLVAMLFDYRGPMRSIPAGPYNIQALSIFLGMIGLLTILFLGDYLISRTGATSFFDLVDSIQRLQVLVHHLPLLLLTGLLGAVAVFGYLATIRQHNYPRFLWLMMDRSIILFLLLGSLLSLSSVSDRLYVTIAPAITGDLDILDKQVVYETFVSLDTQLNLVHKYASQAWEDATGGIIGEVLCIAPPGPVWSSDGLMLRTFPPSTLRLVKEAPLLLESWQATLEGVILYEQVEATMLQDPDSETYQSSSENSEGYVVCGENGMQVAEGIEASLGYLEKARRILDNWIEINGGHPASMDSDRRI